MKNFYGIKLSEPFPFRLYEDCCEMAKYASDNCIKLDELKMSGLSKIIFDEPEKISSPENTTTVHTNQNNKNPEGKEKRRIHNVYQEIANFKEDMLVSKFSFKKKDSFKIFATFFITAINSAASDLFENIHFL